ncbi:MAG: hypothetical protein P4M11_08460 [Candidatus Pacebacteria bacterium]|nr:hypothetical protein [Candidatus Paceibacterota bacterium]
MPNSVRHAVDWILNLVFWGGIVFVVIAHVGSLSDDVKNASICIVSISGLAYFFNAFAVSQCCEFMRYTTMESFCQYLDQVFKESPMIRMQTQSYHYDTRIVTYDTTRGGSETKQERLKVITHSARQEFVYRSFRDVSGSMLFCPSEFLESLKADSMAYVRLNISYEIYFANDGTGDDFVKVRRKFKEDNRRDTNQEYTESFLVGSLQSSDEKSAKNSMVVRIRGDTESLPCVGPWYNCIFTFLTLHALYQTYVARVFCERELKVQKVISTRQDLSSVPACALEYYTPRLVMGKRQVLFKPQSEPRYADLTATTESRMAIPEGAAPFVPVWQFADDQAFGGDASTLTQQNLVQQPSTRMSGPLTPSSSQLKIIPSPEPGDRTRGGSPEKVDPKEDDNNSRV